MPDEIDRHANVTLTDVIVLLGTVSGKIDAIQNSLQDRDDRLRAMVVQAQAIAAVVQTLGTPIGRT